MTMRTRRDLLRDFGLSAAALPFVSGLPSLAAAPKSKPRKQRLIVMFSPNGTLPPDFWQDEPGPLGELKPILKPLLHRLDCRPVQIPTRNFPEFSAMLFCSGISARQAEAASISQQASVGARKVNKETASQ